MFFFFFFFQAEDGIRDGTVTGVQTCALPIYWLREVEPDDFGPGVIRQGRDDDRCHGSISTQNKCPRATNHMVQGQRPTWSERYSITSSAATSSVVGTVRPRARAVWRLISSSNLVGFCTGRSPGLSPLRMRVTYWPIWRYKPEMLGP